MHDYELKDFARDVLEASRHVPVLVDFWAPWCGPCKMLGPLIEKLAAAAAGKWKLVKVNTEEHPVIASEYGISSIPNLKLFHHGKVVDELLGFLPEAQLQQWIDDALPSPNTQAIAEARELLDAGKAGEAAAILDPVVTAEPGNERAKVFLAEAVVVEQSHRAMKLLTGVHEDSDFFNQATALREIAGLCGIPIDQLPAGKGQKGYLAAREALVRRNYAEVMAGVIASLEESGRYAEGAAGKLGKAIVKLLGIRHPVIDQCYRRFSSLLYS